MAVLVKHCKLFHPNDPVPGDFLSEGQDERARPFGMKINNLSTERLVGSRILSVFSASIEYREDLQVVWLLDIRSRRSTTEHREFPKLSAITQLLFMLCGKSKRSLKT